MLKCPRFSVVFLAGGLAYLVMAAVALVACSPGRESSAASSQRVGSQACEDGEQVSGAKYRICMPDQLPWNGDLVLYAHGYVSPDEPIAIPENQLVLGDVSVPDIINSLGYAFATTSYSANGLAVQEGIADLVDLVHVFTTTQAVTPTRVYLGGVSEGGLITALAVEQHPDLFDGGLAACGPTGGLGAQVGYFGDFRVVFDYFFPSLMPGTAITIPQSLIDGWDAHYANVISPTITSPTSAYSLTQLLNVTGAAYDPMDPATMISTTRGLLWYNVFATNQAKDELGGQPYDNQTRVYTGSEDDLRLNAQVSRYQADPAAVAELQAHYETSGQLSVPLVTLHTSLDEIVPSWHMSLYRDKVLATGRWPWYDQVLVPRYGHCAFEPGEVVQAFALLVDRVTNPRPNLSTSRISVRDAEGDGMAGAGEILTYTISITNGGTIDAGLIVTNVLPTGLTYLPGSLSVAFPGAGFTATVGGGALAGHTQGHLHPPSGSALAPAQVATLTYAAQVSDPLPQGTHIVNAIAIQDQRALYSIPPATIRTRYQLWMPYAVRGHVPG